MTEEIQKIIAKMSLEKQKEISRILIEYPQFEEIFLEMFRRKQLAFDLNDDKLLGKYQNDEESFILNKLNKYANES